MSEKRSFSGSLKSSAGGVVGCFVGLGIIGLLGVGGCLVILGGIASNVRESERLSSSIPSSTSPVEGTSEVGGELLNSASNQAPLANDAPPNTSNHNQSVSPGPPGIAAAGETEPSSDSEVESNTSSIPEKPNLPSPDLIVENWRFVTDHGFVKVLGEVTNSSHRKLENVQVIASFYDSSKQLVKTATALLEFNPILAGQTSPFEALDTGNPAIKTASLRFSYLFGGTVSYMTRDDYERPLREAEAERNREEDRRAAALAQKLERERKAAIDKAKERLWTSGEHTVRAKFIKYSAGNVHLRRLDNGKELTIPISRLSEEDQKWIRNSGWKDAAL